MLCQFLLYRKVTQLRTHLFSFLINLLRFYLFYSSLPVRTQVQATGRSPLSGGSQDDTSGRGVAGGWSRLCFGHPLSACPGEQPGAALQAGKEIRRAVNSWGTHTMHSL